MFQYLFHERKVWSNVVELILYQVPLLWKMYINVNLLVFFKHQNHVKKKKIGPLEKIIRLVMGFFFTLISDMNSNFNLCNYIYIYYKKLQLISWDVWDLEKKNQISRLSEHERFSWDAIVLQFCRYHEKIFTYLINVYVLCLYVR